MSEGQPDPGLVLAGFRIGVVAARGVDELVARLERRGAAVTWALAVSHRADGGDGAGRMATLVAAIADRGLDAVAVTSAPAVAVLMAAARSIGRCDDVTSALRVDVAVACLGPLTSAAFETWRVPTTVPGKRHVAAMVEQLETELLTRRDGHRVELVDGRSLLVHGDDVRLDEVEVTLTPTPAAVLAVLVAHPGGIVSRQTLLAALPSGIAESEHAVEMAVARLRAGLGTGAVQTVVKRGYRLAVAAER